MLDTVLAEAFARILVNIMYAPHLGCATTRQLLEEIAARVGDLDYKTVPDGEYVNTNSVVHTEEKAALPQGAEHVVSALEQIANTHLNERSEAYKMRQVARTALSLIANTEALANDQTSSSGGEAAGGGE